MARFCSDHPMTLLAYGTLLGGLLSEKYLGRPEPRRSELNTASLQKYKNMLDAWGDWPLFQELLAVLQHLADNARVFGVKLDADDLSMIEAVLARSRDLMTLIGDCGDEYRS